MSKKIKKEELTSKLKEIVNQHLSVEHRPDSIFGGKISTKGMPETISAIADYIIANYGEQQECVLNHVALYAKHHYQRYSNGNTIWDDIKACLKADGFTPFSNNDILDIIVRNCERLDSHYFRDARTLLNGISPQECWKVAYYTKDHERFMTSKEKLSAPQYDQQEAILRYCLSCLLGTNVELLPKMTEADFQILPRPKD